MNFTVSADPASDLQSQIAALEQQQKEIASKLNAIKNDKSKQNEYKSMLNAQIKNTQNQIAIYEDLYFIESDGMSVKDEQILKLQADLKKKTNGDRHLAIIKDADTMTVRAQNRLLKTLEEPYAGTVIILLSENRENLLETIRSRCVLFRLEDAKENTKGKEIAELVFQELFEEKRFFEIKQTLSAKVKTREDALALLDGLERIYEKLLTWEDPRRKIYSKEEVFKAIESIEAARRDLHAKVNYQYALKNLILKYVF